MDNLLSVLFELVLLLLLICFILVFANIIFETVTDFCLKVYNKITNKDNEKNRI